MTEVIVKYNGDIRAVGEQVGAKVEILSANYAIMTVESYKIEQLTGYTQVEYIEYPKLLELSDKNQELKIMSNEGSFASCIPSEFTGEGILIGLIDSGIEYRLEEFKDKIEYIWDQGAEGTPPEGFFEGSEYNREQISQGNGGTGDSSGHGTHIAGIISNIAPDSNFIIVKLDGNNDFSARSTQIMRAVKYVLDKAVLLQRPIAINLSYGTNDGAHNGASLFETYIDDMCNIWKCSFCVASGNEGESGHHYSQILENGQTSDIEFSVTVLDCYINIYKNITDIFSIEIISPNGISTGQISETSSFNIVGTDIGIIFSQPSPYNVDSSIFINLENTQYGVWKLRLTGISIIEGKIDIWLPSVESVTSSTTFLTPSADTTLTIPSTAHRVISVGSYNSSTGAFSPFSGRGFTADGRVKPDIVAPGENISSLSVFGGVSVLSGTSIACPFVTASAALLMQWGITDGNDPFLYGQRLKAYLRLGASRDSNINYPSTKYGYGKLCLENTFRFLGYRRISSMQMNINPIYSENYIELVAEKNSYVQSILANTNYVKSCEIFNNYTIISVPINEYAALVGSESGRVLLINEPFLMSQGDSESLSGDNIQNALNSSGITSFKNQSVLTLNGNGVLIGIVDTGINFADDEFIFEDGKTKLYSIWNQQEGENDEYGGNDFCYGAVYDEDMINAALSSENPYGIISGDDNGHGTAMAKTVTKIAPQSQIIAVKLKKAKNNLIESKLAQTSEGYSSADIMTAVEYISLTADNINRPVVILIPFGTNEGDHQGNSILERYLGELALRSGKCICLSSGNESDKAHHKALNILSAANETEISVGSSVKGFKLHIWGYSPDLFDFSIISPTGDTVPPISIKGNFYQRYRFSFSGNISVNVISSVYMNNNTMAAIGFENPVSGIWRIRLEPKNVLIGVVHLWLPLTQFLSSEVVFLEPDPFYTATVPSTERFILPVGGYNDSAIYPPSGRGPARDNSVKPYITAPSDASNLIGTGVSAAICAGSAALIFESEVVQRNLLYNTGSITEFMIRGANTMQSEIYPNNIWGFGTLDLYNSFKNN